MKPENVLGIIYRKYHLAVTVNISKQNSKWLLGKGSLKSHYSHRVQKLMCTDLGDNPQEKVNINDAANAISIPYTIK